MIKLTDVNGLSLDLNWGISGVIRLWLLENLRLCGFEHLLAFLSEIRCTNFDINSIF